MSLKTDLIGSGFSMFAAMYVFYVVDPLAQSSILIEKILKVGVYSLLLLSFNLWMRVNNRLNGKDPYGEAALKEHIKLTMFFFAMFALMELPLLIANL